MTSLLCGVDEAGRGPLAGPVFAAAVVLDPGARASTAWPTPSCSTAERREKLAGRIKERALAWAIASASVEEIDRINILRASLLAMRRAVEALACEPDEVCVDGNMLPAISPAAAAPSSKGDALVPAISAASILAKVARDAEMRALDERYPGYGFASTRATPRPSTSRRSAARALRDPPPQLRPGGVFFQGNLFAASWEGMASRCDPQLPAVLRGDEALQRREAARRLRIPGAGACTRPTPTCSPRAKPPRTSTWCSTLLREARAQLRAK